MSEKYSHIKAIFFDAGFTLIHPQPVPSHVAEIAAQHGISADVERMSEARQHGEVFFRTRLSADADIWASDEKVRKFWDGYYTMLLEHGADNLPAEKVALALEAIYELYDTHLGWQLYPEVLTTLDALKRRGYTIGIISDWGSSLAHRIMAPLGVADHCDFIIASAAVGMSKPNAPLFNLALGRTEVNPEQAIMIGDNYLSDVLGARGAGIEGVLIDRWHNFAKPGVPAPDCLMINALDELLNILDLAAYFPDETAHSLE
jgi:putative hydrolase of the HAD superfamily